MEHGAGKIIPNEKPAKSISKTDSRREKMNAQLPNKSERHALLETHALPGTSFFAHYSPGSRLEKHCINPQHTRCALSKSSALRAVESGVETASQKAKTRSLVPESKPPLSHALMSLCRQERLLRFLGYVASVELHSQHPTHICISTLFILQSTDTVQTIHW